MGLGISPVKIKTLLESNPLKSRVLIQRLAVQDLISTFDIDIDELIRWCTEILIH